MSEETEINEQRDSIKLIKNTKGFNYELKLYRIKDEQDKDFLNRIYLINIELENKYGSDK